MPSCFRALALTLTVSLALAVAGCAPQRIMLPGPMIAVAELNHTHIATRDGAALPMREWRPQGPPQAVVVALHGFNDYSNSYDTVGPFLSSRGLAVYAYDQRGFGRGPHPGYWPGGRALADDVAQVARLAATRHPGLPVYLLGESMGAAVIILAMTGERPPPVAGVILSAPAVWGRSTMNVFQRAGLWVAANTLPGMKLSGRGLDIRPSDNIEMLRALSKDPLVIKETRVDAIAGLVDLMDEALASAGRLAVPALVLYGEKDEVVPPAPTWRMMRSLPGPAAGQRLALYPEGFHMLMRDLQADVVLQDIATWIANPAAPLPSGADRRAARVLNGD
ncbi:MAG: alpha/beta hydrolase [Alphaproteobacteria bacterium]|nr:alpha/beta hydrolase [Alphaproteobacteria bacterium]